MSRRASIRTYPLRFGELTVKYITIGRALSKTSLPGLDYALNPYIGCSHGCLYCYAKLYTKIKDVYENWGRFVYVKINLLNKLVKDIEKLRKGSVGVGTITDAYQPIEAFFKLTRRSIELLLNNGFEVSIQTKNPLVLRDTDILLRHRDLVNVGLTITSTSNSKSIIIEPKAPLPSSRISSLVKLSTAGIKTWVFYGPVIPGFNDDEETINEVLKLCLQTNSMLYVDPLRVKRFMLKETHPLNPYLKYLISDRWMREFLELIKKKCLDYGVECRRGFEETSIEN